MDDDGSISVRNRTENLRFSFSQNTDPEKKRSLMYERIEIFSPPAFGEGLERETLYRFLGPVITLTETRAGLEIFKPEKMCVCCGGKRKKEVENCWGGNEFTCRERGKKSYV